VAGGGGVQPKKRDPLPFRLRPYKVTKSTKIAKKNQNREKLQKAPKTGPNGMFTQFLSVFPTQKSKVG
jgi:hypothetical protein